ncbi:hypothetical protein ACFL3X_01405 [Gemmatimonadota bacterium]
MRILWRMFLICVVFSCAFPSTLAQEELSEERIPIAILDLDALGTTPEEAQAISERLRARFLDRTSFDVVERRKMNTIFEEIGFQLSGACNTEECAVQIGRMLGVRKIIFGSISKIGSTYSLMIRMVDMETARIEYVAEADESSIDDIFMESTYQVSWKIEQAYLQDRYPDLPIVLTTKQWIDSDWLRFHSDVSLPVDERFISINYPDAARTLTKIVYPHQPENLEHDVEVVVEATLITDGWLASFKITADDENRWIRDIVYQAFVQWRFAPLGGGDRVDRVIITFRFRKK